MIDNDALIPIRAQRIQIRRRSPLLTGITVEKAQLVSIVTKNRQLHKQLFDEATEAFHKQVKSAYDKIAKKATSKKGLALADARSILNKPTKPSNNLDDYDRVLGMLKLETHDQVKLTAEEYEQFVEDNWSWKGRFNEQYFATTGKFSG